MKDSMCDFFQKEDIKRCMKDVVKPIVHIVYNEIYPYLWFICLYHVFLIFVTLINLILLTRIIRMNQKIEKMSSL